jgi:hypothetical protein
MGVDIHMYICRKGKLSEQIFQGMRNSEWFDNLCQNGDDEYDYLPVKFGIAPFADKLVQSAKDKDEELNYCPYYGFHFIKVKDFKEWFEEYRPDRKAGWVSTYDKWRIERKSYIPDCPTIWKNPDAGDDQYFVEFEDPYDMSKHLYDYLKKHRISNKAYITYFFDC